MGVFRGGWGVEEREWGVGSGELGVETGLAGCGDELWRKGVGGGGGFDFGTLRRSHLLSISLTNLGSPLLILPAYSPPRAQFPNPPKIPHASFIAPNRHVVQVDLLDNWAGWLTWKLCG